MVMAAYSSTDKKKTAGVSFEELVKEIKAGQFKPVYYLMGDEAFYIDRLSVFFTSISFSSKYFPSPVKK